MAKRRKSKTRKSSPARRLGISAKKYNQLKREAENARRRIGVFNKRDDAGLYSVPLASNYTLAQLSARIASGENINAIISELKNITATSIIESPSITYESVSGYILSPHEVVNLRKSVDVANRNIRAAKAKYTDFVDVMPEEFNFTDLVSGVITKETLQNLMGDLSLFTSDNLRPFAVPQTGEATSYAEYLYRRNALERENLRRAKLREENDPLKVEGFFRQQADYDTQEIPIDKLSLELLKKRSETWSDKARLVRANTFLTNYKNKLDDYEAALINHGMMNSELEQRIDNIIKIIDRLFWNEKAITFLSTRMPDISIQLIYETEIKEGEDLNSIYNAWTDVKGMFL